MALGLSRKYDIRNIKHKRSSSLNLKSRSNPWRQSPRVPHLLSRLPRARRGEYLFLLWT